MQFEQDICCWPEASKSGIIVAAAESLDGGLASCWLRSVVGVNNWLFPVEIAVDCGAELIDNKVDVDDELVDVDADCCCCGAA